jgi:hypothetical protein
VVGRQGDHRPQPRLTVAVTAFEQFFTGEFRRRLNAVRSEPGLLTSGLPIEGASWDRRAAWLLWQSERQRSPPDPLDDLLG